MWTTYSMNCRTTRIRYCKYRRMMSSPSGLDFFMPAFKDKYTGLTRIREAIINAVLHNYWASGNEPMISVYSDKIEILSRGTLAPAQTMEGFYLGESVPVNEKLSEIFLQLHISEKSGRGVPTIIDTYGKEAITGSTWGSSCRTTG